MKLIPMFNQAFGECMKKKKNTLFQKLFSVYGIIIVSKLLGFAKQLFVANAFGATIETDLISLSQGIVIDFEFLIIQTLVTSFIPIYIALKAKSKELSKEFAENTIKLFFLISITASAGIIMISGILSKIIAPTYTKELSLRLAHYICIFAPALIFIILIAIFNALLKANEHFISGELISVIQSLAFILSIIVLGEKLGVNALIIGFYSYLIISLLFLSFFSGKYWHLSFKSLFINDEIRKLLKMIGPLLMGYSMIYINQQVDRVLVSGVAAGAVTAMSYSAVLSNFVSTFTSAGCSVVFVYIAQSVAKNRHKEAAFLVKKFAVLLTTLLLPISILTIFNSKDIVTIIFGRGAFDQEAVRNSAYALTGYAFSFVPLIYKELYSRLQYSYMDSKHPMINSSIGIIVNTILSIALCPLFGILAVTITTSVSAAISAVLNMKTSKKHNIYLNRRGLLEYMPYWLLGGIVCIILTVLGQRYFVRQSALLRFTAIMISSGVCYCAAILPIIIKIKKNKVYD